MTAETIGSPAEDIGAEELRARRERVYDFIGRDALAIVQGSPGVSTFNRYRQTNEFYHLSGVETPGATMLLNGRKRQTSIYLPHRDAHRQKNEGKMLSAEDEDEVKAVSGADAVAGPEHLALDLAYALWRTGSPSVMFTPLNPGEGVAATRDMLLVGTADAVNDPWDGGGTREGRLVRLLRDRFPQLELRDLSPLLDGMRLLKSPTEIERMRVAGRLCGLGVMEAMRVTEPGVYEYQLGAVAQFVYMAGGAAGEGYRAIIAGGSNTMMGHYYTNHCPLNAGDLVLMDYAPDYRYYTSDIGRVWPVSGRFEPYQRQLYSFVLEYHKQLLARIKPGVTAEEVSAGAEEAMRPVLDGMTFEKPIYAQACRNAMGRRGFLSHSVGMSVHDVGNYDPDPFAPGLVFSVDPGVAVPEENFSLRVEDTVVVTESGMENLTGFVPIELNEIEEFMQGRSLLRALNESEAESGHKP